MTNLQKAIKVIVVAAAAVDDDDDDDAGTKASKYLASFMKCMKNSHTSTYLPTYLPTFTQKRLYFRPLLLLTLSLITTYLPTFSLNS